MAQLPTLRKGSKEKEAVKGLQNALNRFFGPIAVDGVFGSNTEHVVKDFQGDRGLDVDGIVGPMTWEALHVHLVQKGDTLSGIAEHHLGDADRWPEIFGLNEALVSDPDKIRPGQVLSLP